MDKGAMRQNLRLARESISAQLRASHSDRICRRILELSVWQDAGRVLVYHPIGSEVDTTPLIRDAWAAGKRVGLPRVEGERFVAAIVDPATHLTPGRFGIPQPPSDAPTSEEWDLVIVPGLGFDTRGHRIGYGKGMYDHWLAAHPTAVRVGVAFTKCFLSELPHDSNDMPVTWVVTPEETHAAKV